MQVIESLENKDYLQISVIDTGVGIKDEEKYKLFAAFGKLEDQQGLNKNGIGLGLTIANALSLALSGRIDEDGEKGIEVESKLGKGSRFYFKILKDVANQPVLNVKDVRIDLGAVEEEESILDTEELTVNQDQVHSKMLNRNRPRKSLCSKFEEGISPTNKSPTLKALLPSRAPTRHNSRKKSLKFEDLKIMTSGSIVVTVYDGENENSLVIIVDDNPFNLFIAERLIKDLGYLTKTAKGSHEAIEVIKSCSKEGQKIKMILMDCEMPIMDGFETTKILTKMMDSGEVQKAPIIALTAHSNQRDIERCFESGMVGYLAKPLQKQKLQGVLKEN